MTAGDGLPSVSRDPRFAALTRLDATVSIDRVGIITEWNTAAEQMFGWLESEALGQPLVNLIIPERYRDAHVRGLARLHATGEGPILGRRIELEGLRRDHREFPVELTIVADDSDTGTLAYSALIRDLTEQRGLLADQRLLAAIVESSDDAIMVLDPDTVIVTWNPGAERVYGYTAAETIGLPIAMLIPPGRAGEERELLSRVLAGERVEHFETTRLRSDGREIDVSLSLSPLRDATGEVIGACGIGRDISEAKRLERDLTRARQEAAEDRFRTALDAMPDLVTIQSAVRDDTGAIVDFCIEHMNPVNLTLVGLSAADVIGRRLSEVFPDRVDTAIPQAMRRVVESGAPELIEDHTFRWRSEGQPVLGHFTVQVAPFGDGVIVAARDITAEHLARRELEDAYEQLQAAQALAHIGTFSVDLEQGEMTISDELRRIIGLGPDESIPDLGDAIARFIVPKDQEMVRDIILDAPNRDEPFPAEVRVRRANETRVVSAFVTVARDDEGTLTRVWGTAQDVTEKRRAEAQLREATVAAEEQHATVELLQRAFVPQLPVLEHIEIAATYRPAGANGIVGGDWYDAFRTGEDTVDFVVGDVAGHGVPAAALMAQLRNTVRGLAHEGYQPGQALAAMNRLMISHHPTAMATALIGRIDRNDGTLTWSSAGHPPPVIYRPPAAAHLHAPRASGPPLGTFATATYAEHQLTLTPDTLVVAFTDGLFERRGEHLDVGLARVFAAVPRLAGVPLATFCDELYDQVLEGAVPRDDVCVVALRYVGEHRTPGGRGGGT